MNGKMMESTHMTVVDAKLYLMHYYGAESYYFEKYRADAEKVIVTSRFGKGTGH